MQLADFEIKVEEFMIYCTSKRLSKKTLQSYEQTLKLFYCYLKENFKVEDVEKVTKSHIRQYVNYLQERGKYNVNLDNVNNNPSARNDFKKSISDTTINNYLRNIRVFFNWLQEEEELKINPMDKIKPLKSPERLKPLLDKKELDAIFNSFNKTKFDGYRNYIITKFLLDTGCRITECLSITIDNIDLKNNLVLLQNNTKGRKNRYVFFSLKIKTELKRWLQYKDRYLETDLLFPSNRGNLMQAGTYETALRNVGKKLGINLYPHRIRSSFAQYYLLNGGDLFTLSKILGHSNIEVTKIYLQLDEKTISQQHQKFSPLNNLDI